MNVDPLCSPPHTPSGAGAAVAAPHPIQITRTTISGPSTTWSTVTTPTRNAFDYYEVECSLIDAIKECDRLVLKFESKAGNC
mmetsp:Transcript_27072/g.25943  ORF Transcript_27072/g.25943 Transcript_27072/m.25943 type:complete len:82 (-) Transcript_27072:19-264(-)